MDTKLLLVKSITLLFRESQVIPITMNSASMINDILTIIKLPETYVSGDFANTGVTALQETLRWMANNSLTHTYDKNELLQRLHVNCGNDESLYECFVQGIQPDLGEEALKAMIVSYRKSLFTFTNQEKVKAIMKRFTNQLMFQPQTIDWRCIIPTIKQELEPFNDLDEGSSSESKHLVTRVNFNDFNSVRNTLARGQEELKSVGVFKMGLQGLNRMTGQFGGLRRGESVLTSALQSNYKSGLCLDMFRWAAIYNQPYMIDPQRKPLLIRMSLENKVEQDILTLYKSLAENETGLPVDTACVDVDEATRYVIQELTKNGFHIDMSLYDPSEMTFYDIFQMIEQFEKDGYEVQLLNIDYLNMISKKGCAQGPHGVDIRDLYRRMKNFCAKRSTTFITPHQLSSDAKGLIRGNFSQGDFVKEIAGKGYYDGCKGLDQEPDLEIHQHIAIVGEEKYLTLRRGKHRKNGETPMSDLYCVYKFENYANIPDDLYRKDQSRKSVGGGTVAEGGMPAWWGEA